jgi:hypothetical protein
MRTLCRIEIHEILDASTVGLHGGRHAVLGAFWCGLDPRGTAPADSAAAGPVWRKRPVSYKSPYSVDMCAASEIARDRDRRVRLCAVLRSDRAKAELDLGL